MKQQFISLAEAEQQQQQPPTADASLFVVVTLACTRVLPPALFIVTCTGLLKARSRVWRFLRL